MEASMQSQDRIDAVEIGLRVYQETPQARYKRRRAAEQALAAEHTELRRLRPWRLDWVRLLIIIDVETATTNTRTMPGFQGPHWCDYTQPLLFGRVHIVRLCRRPHWAHDHARCVPHVQREILFYPDDLPRQGVEQLAAIHAAMQDTFTQEYVDSDERTVLTPRELLPLSPLLNDVLWPILRDEGERAYLVGYNVLYDLSRLACAWRVLRRTKDTLLRDGFALSLFTHAGAPSTQRPERCCQLPSGGALMRWGAYATGGEAQSRQLHPSLQNLLDTANLIHGLTGQPHTLEAACRAMGLPEDEWKHPVTQHGVITPDYVAYNRQDVLATTAVTLAALRRYEAIGLSKPPTQIYSAASVAKAVLDDLGVQPRLVRQPQLARYQGIGMEAYYGGRVECRIRGCAVPVVYVDFNSLYSTVSALSGLWRLTTASRVPHGPRLHRFLRLIAFLQTVTAEQLFRSDRLAHTQCIRAAACPGDALPMRARFDGKNWRSRRTALLVGRRAVVSARQSDCKRPQDRPRARSPEGGAPDPQRRCSVEPAAANPVARADHRSRPGDPTSASSKSVPT